MRPLPRGCLPPPLLLLLAAAAMLSTGPTGANAQGTVVFEDTFASLMPAPFGQASNWTFPFIIDPFTANANFSSIPGGGSQLAVVPFNATDITAGDHLKSLVFLNTNVFDPNATSVRGRKVRYSLLMGVRQSKMSNHPFGRTAITKRNDDMRMGVCGLSVDENYIGVGLNLVMTDNGIWATYARQPFARSPENNYDAFYQLKRLGSRQTGDFHDVAIEYDPVNNTISYFVNGALRWLVTRPGFKQPEVDGVRTIIDWGGEERPIPPPGQPMLFSSGFGCFALLESLDYWNPEGGSGLVALLPRPQFPTRFYDEGGRVGTLTTNRLWGQGATLSMRRFRITVG